MGAAVRMWEYLLACMCACMVSKWERRRAARGEVGGEPKIPRKFAGVEVFDAV